MVSGPCAKVNEPKDLSTIERGDAVITLVVVIKKTEIAFNRYGDKLVLKSIMVEGATIGATSVARHIERQHKKAFGKPVKVARSATKKKR